MSLYIVTYTHPDEAGWQKHMMAHVAYLQDLLKTGVLRASGPFKDTPVKSAMLIIEVADKDALMEIIEQDPFAIEGLIEDMTIAKWDPIFGAFNSESSMPTSLDA